MKNMRSGQGRTPEQLETNERVAVYAFIAFIALAIINIIL